MRAVVQRIVDVYTGPLFRAALELWVAAASDAQLGARRSLPSSGASAARRTASPSSCSAPTSRRPGVREAIQATLDLARGLGVASLLSDDRRRRERIVAYWTAPWKRRRLPTLRMVRDVPVAPARQPRA